MPFAVVLAFTLQTAGGGVRPTPTARTATAVRAEHPPAIDGRDDDPVWHEAPAITQFREFQPKEERDHLQPDARRNREPRLRPGRGRSGGAQPHRVRAVLPGAAAVFRPGCGALPL